MKNKNLIYFIVGILVLIFVLGGIFLYGDFLNKDKNLPDSFKMSINADFSSGGGSRSLRSELVFSEGLIVSGWENFSASTFEGNYEYYCIVNNLYWVNITGGTDCGINSIPLTIEELQQKISSGEFKKAGEDCFPHSNYCYTLD